MQEIAVSLAILLSNLKPVLSEYHRPRITIALAEIVIIGCQLTRLNVCNKIIYVL